jgi:hypothetical protein
MTNKRRRKPGDGLGKIEDGDVMTFPVQFMDHDTTDEFEKLAKASPHDGFGRVAGFKPGFAYGDVALREAAHTAYEERRQRLGGPVRKPTSLADAQAAVIESAEAVELARAQALDPRLATSAIDAARALLESADLPPTVGKRP